MHIDDGKGRERKRERERERGREGGGVSETDTWTERETALDTEEGDRERVGREVGVYLGRYGQGEEYYNYLEN